MVNRFVVEFFVWVLYLIRVVFVCINFFKFGLLWVFSNSEDE